MTFGKFLFLKFLNKVCGFLDLKWFLNECCVENEASKEGSPESREFLEFRATGEMILDKMYILVIWKTLYYVSLNATWQ